MALGGFFQAILGLIALFDHSYFVPRTDDLLVVKGDGAWGWGLLDVIVIYALGAHGWEVERS